MAIEEAAVPIKAGKPSTRSEYAMNLAEVPIGHRARVISVSGQDRIATRLKEMGVVPGAEVTVVKTAPFGDPLQLRLMGYSLAVRLSEARAVSVEDVTTV
jgi:Fe2+ transport system protein FeoA